MDNVVYHPHKPEIIGILDWELCALGAPVRYQTSIRHN
jgi:aminoglycoside phosphotransferase (APT) family kinase protein